MLSYIKHITFIFLTINLFASVNFTDPTSTPPPAPQIPPDLSVNGRTTYRPQIATNSTGQYVYAVWERHNGTFYVIQVARSSDYGINWVNPTTVTGDQVPDLSLGRHPPLTDGNAQKAQIITNSTGQYVYAIWERYDGSKYIIQVSISSDYGVNWVDPTTTTGTSVPNLSLDGQPASLSQIATSSTGQYVYVVWRRYDGSNYIIQTVNGIDTLAGVTLQVSGTQVQIRFPFQIDVINKLVWNNLPKTLSYKIYTNAALTNLLAEIPAPTNHYEDNQIKRGERKTYYITWVDSDHHEHEATVVTIP